MQERRMMDLRRIAQGGEATGVEALSTLHQSITFLFLGGE